VGRVDSIVAIISPHEWSVLARLLVATVLAAVIGLERERSGKIAGMRTHTLVSLGAALFTVISLKLYEGYPSLGGVPGFDYHIVANIIVGIGFIGAGTILRLEDRVVGTTTAASLWVVAAIGIASGMGFFREAVATTVLAYAVLALLWTFEKRIRRNGNGHTA
jgi:putative Mg2+ transporter-C (MgtC) family protein